MWWLVGDAAAADRCAAVERALRVPPVQADRPAPPDVVPKAPTGWTEEPRVPAMAAVAGGLGAAWVVRGGKLWKGSGGDLHAVDLPFSPDAVAVAGDRLVVVAQAGDGIGHLAIVDAMGTVERELAWKADVRGVVARGGSWLLAVRGRPPTAEALRAGLVVAREKTVETPLFDCASLPTPVGAIDRWEGIVELPATGPPRGIVAALGPVPFAFGRDVAWAAGDRLSWWPADAPQPISSVLPFPAVEVRSGPAGATVRWEWRGAQGISVFSARQTALVEVLRRGARDDNPDGGGLSDGQGWLAWVRDTTTPGSGWRVMSVDLSAGTTEVHARPSLPVVPPAEDRELTSAVATLDPKPTWYLPPPVSEWLGTAALGDQRVGASTAGVAVLQADGRLAWSAPFPPPKLSSAASESPYRCGSGRVLDPHAWTLVQVGETTTPRWSAVLEAGQVEFAARGRLFTWDGADRREVAKLPDGARALDLSGAPIALDATGRLLELVGHRFKWTRLPVPPGSTAVRGPGGPVVLADDGSGAWDVNGLLLAPNEPFSAISLLAGGASHVAAASAEGVQLLEAGQRTPLARVGVDVGEVSELVAPDAVLALGTAVGGRTGAWAWNDEAGLFPIVRGDVPLLPGGVPPEAIRDLAARDFRFAVHVALRGGGAGVVEVDGCRISPVVGDGDGNTLDAATVASPWSVGPDGSVLLAVPLGATGLWTLWLARPD